MFLTVPLGLSLQDLEYLCEGLEGRSSNPVAVLFDSLLLPDSDFGLDHTSPLEWRYEPERAIPHLVLGKGPPGGAWHVRSLNYPTDLWTTIRSKHRTGMI